MSETAEARGMMRGTSSAGDVIVRYVDKRDHALEVRIPTSRAKAEHPRSVTINRHIIEAAASGRDAIGRPMGWTVAQVSIIDSVTRGKRRLRVGWRARAEGVVIPWAEAVRFMTAAKTKKNRPKPGSRAEAEAIDTLRRLVACKPAVGARHQSLPHGGLIRPPSPTVKRQTLKPESKLPEPEDMLALLLGDDTACPICRGSRQNHIGEPCALCIKSPAIHVYSDTPPWE